MWCMEASHGWHACKVNIIAITCKRCNVNIVSNAICVFSICNVRNVMYVICATYVIRVMYVMYVMPVMYVM